MSGLAAVALVAAGCATGGGGRPIGPAPAEISAQRGQTAEQQASDRAACETVAREQSGYSPTTQTAKGAGVGAAIGALGGAAAGAAIGAATDGDVGKSAAIGAGVGGLGGAATGGAYQYSRSREGHDAAFANCMSARGYTVSYDRTRF
jgi:hypothetical protein